MTEKKIKEIIGIKEWSEVNNPEQFSLLMANFHMLSPGVRTKVISRLSDLRGLTEMFYDNIAAAFITYEPTVIMIFDPLLKIMEIIHEECGGKLTKKDNEFVAEMYRSFSEWYATDEGILLQTNTFEEMCTADEAYNLLHCIDDGLVKFSDVSMMLMTIERNEFIKQVEKEAEELYSIDVDFLRDVMGHEPDKKTLDQSFRKYIN